MYKNSQEREFKIAFSKEYVLELPEKHPFPIQKYKLIPEKLLKDFVITEEDFFKPEIIDRSILELTHTKEYIDKVIGLELSPSEIRKIGFPLSKELVERELLITHGTLQCCFYAMQNGVSLNIAGGTHHSFADSGSGFCIFNDVAVSANYLLKNNYSKKIMIIDLDVHQGNGNARIFENNPDVFTFSMHGEKNFPLKKENSDYDIALPDNTEDELYMELLSKNLPLLIENFNPDFLFYISGVDILKGDKFGRISLSKEACKKRDEFVFIKAREKNIPIVAVMGGGYSKDINEIVEAHCNTFRTAKEIFNLC